MSNWTLEEVSPFDILNHPSNVSIYGVETVDSDLVQSIRDNGILIPGHCVRNSEGKLVALDGHRRKNAAREAGQVTIPVRVYAGEMPHEEQVIWICEANRQRKKTAEQATREGLALAEAYAVQAEKRMKWAAKAETSTPRATLPQGSEKGRARDQAAKQVGVSRRTLDAGEKAVAAIDEAEAKGDKATAEKIRTTLNTKGASPAAKLVEAAKKVIEESEAETAVDHFKVNVDEDFSPAFEQRKDFRKLLASISGLKSEALELAEGPGGKWIDAQEVEQICDNLRRAIRFGQPYTECGRCKRDKVKRRACQSCKGRGWLCESAYNTQSAEDKAWIANRK